MKNLFFNFPVFSLILVFAFFEVHAQKSNKPATQPITKIQSPTENKSNSKESQTEQKLLLSTMEIAVIDEINEARKDPQKFVGYLEEYKKAMKGNILAMPNQTGIIMIEGASVIDEAISDLKKISKIEPLSISNGLFKAANLQLSDLKQDSTLSHRGKNGSDVGQRLLKFGFPGSNIAENICYRVSVAREVVMTMILDDGFKSRSHRKNIFAPRFKQIGVACGTSNKNDSLCVAVFADTFQESK